MDKNYFESEFLPNILAFIKQTQMTQEEFEELLNSNSSVPQKEDDVDKLLVKLNSIHHETKAQFYFQMFLSLVLACVFLASIFILAKNYM